MFKFSPGAPTSFIVRRKHLNKASNRGGSKVSGYTGKEPLCS